MLPKATTLAVLLALSTLLLPSESAAPPQPITALAPFSVWADGFDDVRGIVVDDDDGVFVADHHRGVVVRIAPDHTQRVVARQLDRPIGLAFDSARRLIVAEEGSGRVLRLEPAGTWSVLVSGLKQPRWLAVDDDGTIYVSARRLTRRATVEADDADAEPQLVVAISASRGARVFADNLRRVEGLAVAADALFVATRGRRDSARSDGVVLRIPILADGSGGSIALVGADDRYKMPLGLARDVLGNIWLAAPEVTLGGSKSKDVVAKLRADGTLTRFAAGLSDPQGLAFDSRGNLFLTDGNKGRVVRFEAPAAPVATLPPFTNQAQLAVSGTGDPGARIDVFVDDATTGTSGSANSAGAFTVPVPLAPNHSNAVALYLTAHAGDGLSAPAVELETVHDGVAPAVTLTAPAAASFVRGTVTVSAQASDGGSAIAAMTLTADGAPLSTTVAPALPSAAVTAGASWNTTALSDGAREIRASAADRSGNVQTARRTVIVDNTPPDTTIAAGPAGEIQVTTASFTIAGSDALAPAAQLQFAWRLDGGPWSSFSSTARVDFATLAAGAHTFEAKARDLAGNEDPTPARRDFAVRLGGVRIAITQPTAGASVPAGLVLVTGTASGAAVVTVNGVPAMVQGTIFAALIPVDESTNAIIGTVTAGDSTATATVPITVTPGTLSSTMLIASPMMGVAPLTVTFSMAGVPSGATLALDADGDGTIDVTSNVETGANFTYTTPGLYVARATAAGATANAVVHVLDRAALDAMLQAMWNAMKDALRAADVPRAVGNITSRNRADYGTAFGLISRLLPGIDSILTTVTLVEVRSGSAIYEMLRTDDGILRSFEVRFAVDNDGLWRLDSF
jgi:sugar lactone lactonase YvrE